MKLESIVCCVSSQINSVQYDIIMNVILYIELNIYLLFLNMLCLKHAHFKLHSEI